MASRPPTKQAQWTPKENAILAKMREDNCSWEEISAAPALSESGGDSSTLLYEV